MEQRELVRTGNDGKPSAFAIVLVMHLNDLSNLLAESKVFGSIVMEWFATRGSTAESVHLCAVSEPKCHAAIKELFELLHAGDINLRQVFDAVPFRISFHNPKGTQMSEMELRPLTEAKRGGIVTRIMKKVTGRT